MTRVETRDRLWQSFLCTPECQRHSVEAITALCRWWFMRGMVEDMKGKRRVWRRH